MSRESPIMFIDEMVRAIEAGTKDTTRRVCPESCQFAPGFAEDSAIKEALKHAHKPGDLLWVRQSMICNAASARLPCGGNGQPLWPTFAAESSRSAFIDQHAVYTHVLPESTVVRAIKSGLYVRMNKMFQPRWASRLELRVLSVHVERLSAMTDSEARREGFRASGRYNGLLDGDQPHLASFMATWEKIHKASKFGRRFPDPLLFVYRFEVARHTRHIQVEGEWINHHYKALLT